MEHVGGVGGVGSVRARGHVGGVGSVGSVRERGRRGKRADAVMVQSVLWRRQLSFPVLGAT